MIITPIQNIQNRNIKFTANMRNVYDKSGKMLYKTTTYYFRDDLWWNELVRYICCKYRNVNHVNFINHACSNGMEPASFVMAFLKNCPKDIDKFTPILAKDIDIDNIMAAKKGQCGVSHEDFMRICNYTGKDRNNFLEIKPSIDNNNLFIMSPKKIISDRIIFKQGDIFDDIENMPEENTLLSCRNFWGYLSLEKQEELASRLGKKLQGNSSVLIGYIDTQNAIDIKNFRAYADILLENNGFKRCPIGTKHNNIMYTKSY